MPDVTETSPPHKPGPPTPPKSPPPVALAASASNTGPARSGASGPAAGSPASGSASPKSPAPPGPPPRQTPPPPPPPPSPSRVPLVLGAVGFLALAGVAAWQWTELQDLHQQVDSLAQAAPQPPPTGGVDPGRLAALETEIQTLQPRLKALEDRPAAEPNAAAPPPVDLGPLLGRITALEERKPPEPPPAPDLAPLEARIAALEARKPPEPPPPFDDSALKSQLAAVTAQVTDLTKKLAAAQETATTSDDHAARAARVESATLALAAGKPLGPLPDAPPALAAYATAAPPTEASLRLSFETAAHDALKASDPASGTTDPAKRMWQRLESLVTVRKGDQVLVGQPAAVVLAEARKYLVAGDLAGAVSALDKLDPPAAKVMAGWRSEAQALLDARAALASMAAS